METRKKILKSKVKNGKKKVNISNLFLYFNLILSFKKLKIVKSNFKNRILKNLYDICYRLYSIKCMKSRKMIKTSK